MKDDEAEAVVEKYRNRLDGVWESEYTTEDAIVLELLTVIDYQRFKLKRLNRNHQAEISRVRQCNKDLESSMLEIATITDEYRTESET